jgi:integrase/recombinase XerD
MRIVKAKHDDELLERRIGRSSEESVDDDEDVGGDDEEQKVYRNAMEEILAEFGDELIGGYFGKEGKKRGKRVRRLPATLLREECRLLMTAHTKGKWAFRNNLIIRLMYAAGIRLAEEENLNVADIRFADQTMFVRVGKEKKDRYVCVDSETLSLLKTWIESEGKKLEDSLFDLSDRQIARVIEEAGEITGVAQKYAGMERRFSPHSLRHSFATHCYENGMDLFVLKKLMGHEYLGTTLIYVETAMAREREEYVKTGPLGG